MQLKPNRWKLKSEISSVDLHLDQTPVSRDNWVYPYQCAHGIYCGLGILGDYNP